MTESKQIHVINNSDEVSFFEWVCMEPIRSEKKVDQIQGVERYLEVYPKVATPKQHVDRFTKFFIQ